MKKRKKKETGKLVHQRAHYRLSKPIRLNNAEQKKAKYAQSCFGTSASQNKRKTHTVVEKRMKIINKQTQREKSILGKKAKKQANDFSTFRVNRTMCHVLGVSNNAFLSHDTAFRIERVLDNFKIIGSRSS